MVAVSSPGASPPASAVSVREATCLHCRLPLATGCTSAFCCRGCEAVHALLADAGLERYYDLGGGEGHPVAQSSVDHKWLEPIALRLAAQPPGLTRDHPRRAGRPLLRVRVAPRRDLPASAERRRHRRQPRRRLGRADDRAGLPARQLRRTTSRRSGTASGRRSRATPTARRARTSSGAWACASPSR